MDKNNNRKYKSYCVCLGEPLREVIIEAQQDKIKFLGTDEEDFYTGYLNGIRRVITLMQEAAELREIPFNDLGIDFDERDLI